MTRLKDDARILIVKFNAIGDVIMTTPAVRDLREAYPKAHIAMLVGAWSAPAIRKSPHLDEVIEFDQQMFVERRWPGIFRLLLKLRRGRYDCAVIFHALPSIHLFIRLAGIPVRYGLTRAGHHRFLTAAVPENLAEDRYYAENYQEVTALAGARSGEPRSEVHADAGDEAAVARMLAAEGLGPEEDYLLVAPGGARNPLEDMSARRWPSERFAELILDVLKDRPGLRIVLSGGPGDRAETGHIAQRIPGAVDLTGKIALSELFCVARRARAVLCNDSSALHIGIACGVPVVAAFGPTSAKQRMPLWALPYAWQSTGSGAAGRRLSEVGSSSLRPLLDRALARPFVANSVRFPPS